MLPLSLIEADELQPRKNFSPARLSELMRSIKRHGIMNPLIVQRQAGGRYILVDGERRYRASKELKLDEVPAIVHEVQDDTERLIQQFHLQEQHEGWSALEKALAVSRLSETLKVDVKDLAEMLSLPQKTVSDYVAFSKLLERKEYAKSEVPLGYAKTINNLKTFAKRMYREIDEEFDNSMERNLEKAIISRFKSGDIRKAGDINKIHDAIRMEPKMLEKLIKDENTSIERLFLQSKAKAAWHYRNVVNNSSVMASHIKQGLEDNMLPLFKNNERAQNTVKTAHRRLGELINKF